MSFIVQIIDAALPSDATQCQRAIDRLVTEHHASDLTPSLALGKLYQQLVVQYPCLSSLQEENSEACVWAESPLIRNFGPRIAVLNIAHNELQVLAFILKLAGELNLKVVDAQSGKVYYPRSTEALDFIATRAVPVAPKEKPLTEKIVLDFLVERIRLLFEPAGFVWDSKAKWAQRSVSYGNQCIWLGVEKKRDKFVIYITARFYILAVGELVRKITGDLSANGYIGCQYEYFTDQMKPPEVRDMDELALVSKSIEALTINTIVPFFEDTITLDALSSALNNHEKCRRFISTFLHEVLSLAFLVEPTKIQETADLYRSYIRYRNWPEESIVKIDEIVDRLAALNSSS